MNRKKITEQAIKNSIKNTGGKFIDPNDIKIKCKHKWKEDEMFACGAISMICGSPNDLGEETKMICEKCGAFDFVVKKKLGSLSKFLK